MSNRINSNGLIEKEKKMPEKTPLNGNTYVNSFQFKNEVLVFKASLPLRVLLFLLRILNICLWALILYHFYNGNFWIHSKAPFVVDIFINILLYISVPMLSIGLWYFRRKSRKKQFIDKQTQEINLFSNSDKKYTFKDIKAVQIIDYLKNIRTTSEF